MNETIKCELEIASYGGCLVRGPLRNVVLTDLEYQFILLLQRQRDEDRDRGEGVRGYVPVESILHSNLPFKTLEPTRENIRQLIRRVRRKLGRAGLVRQSIEGSRGLGYRLPVDFLASTYAPPS